MSTAGCAIQAVGSLFQLAPLVVLGGSQYLSVFKAEPRAAGATASGRTSDAAAVRGDAGPDRAVADTHGIKSIGSSQQRHPVDNRLGEGEVLQEWRNIGRFSAVLVRISDCWGVLQIKIFSRMRMGEMGVHLVPFLKSKRRFRSK